MDVCIDLMEAVMASYALGETVNPLRQATRVSARGTILGTMPGYVGDPEAFGLKAVAIIPGNHGGPLDGHQGLVVLFDPETGVPIAILDGSEVTAIRTAAASAAATRRLAREDSRNLALIGSGVQASTHLDAMRAVLPIERVRVFSPSRERREGLAARAAADGLDARAADSAEEALRDADVVCTVTSAREPVVFARMLGPGVHINAVGACVPDARELDVDLLRGARIFVDSVESAMNEAGDLIIPRERGDLGEEIIEGEIGEVYAGRKEARRSAAEVTVYKSLGIAVQDLAVARYVLDRAERDGVGVTVPLGGEARG